MELNTQVIAEYLRPYQETLNAKYNWKASYTGLNKALNGELDSTTELFFNGDASEFSKVERLKEIASSLIKNPGDVRGLNKQFALWLIREWGGIHGGSDPDTIQTIKQFYKSTPFTRIASVTKYAAFTEPDQHIIYDSRLAYSLNWIILSTKAGSRYFPIPEGRNSKMKAFDLEVLIHLSNLEHYKVDSLEELAKENKLISRKGKELYYDKSEAYFNMNSLLGEIGKILYPEKSDGRFYVQMLLFAIADTEIYRDIVGRVKLTIAD